MAVRNEKWNHDKVISVTAGDMKKIVTRDWAL